MSRCDDIRLELGGYALGGLTAAERSRVDEHLRDCPDCRAELEELSELPPLLDLVAEAPPQPPPQLRERVLATAGRRRARRRLATLVAAALLLGAVIGGGATMTVWPGAGQDDPLTVPLTPGEGFEAHGVAELRDVDDGLRVRLDLEGVPPLPDPGVYEAWLAPPDSDEPVSIGRFAGSREGRVDISLLAEGDARDYEYIWVTAEPDAGRPVHEGPTVVAAPLHDDGAESGG